MITRVDTGAVRLGLCPEVLQPHPLPAFLGVRLPPSSYEDGTPGVVWEVLVGESVQREGRVHWMCPKAKQTFVPIGKPPFFFHVEGSFL